MASVPSRLRELTASEGRPALPALSQLLGLTGPLLAVAGMGVATYSVVRYDLRIVAAYTALAVLLAVGLARRRSGAATGRAGWALTLAVAGILTMTVPTFTHISPAEDSPAPLVLGLTALSVAALLLVPGRRGPDAALAVAVLGYLGASAALIRLDPAPRIDVWVILQQAADGLLRGDNPYTQEWVGSPGVRDAFTYLPWTAVLLAPGRWLAGDVRWALVVVAVLTALVVRALPGRAAAPHRRSAAVAVAALLLLLPGTATQVEQAWTEPLLLLCLAGATLAVIRGRLLAAVLLFGLGLACKQHLALLLPLLAAWPRFGPWRAAASAGVAGVLVLPWVVADPGAFFRDTVTLLVTFHPIKFADTLYLAALTELGWTPPFWLTGAIVLGTLAAVALAVRRRDPGPGELLRWAALVLFVASLVNKQAFYNQYWLVAGLVLISWAVPDEADRLADQDGGAEAGDPGQRPQRADDATVRR